MKDLWGFLSIIAFVFGATACGGGSSGGTPAGTTNSISGTTIAGATLNMSGNATASTTADTSGKYSFSGLSNGSYVITPSFTGYAFSPLNATINFTGGNYSGIDFAATPNTGGVTLSGTLGGFNSVANTSPSNSVFVSGGETVTTGSLYAWGDASGAGAGLGYTSLNNTINVNLPSSGYGTGCGVSSTVVVGLETYPICSSIGITFNHATGTITFSSTPLLYGPVQPGLSPSTGITATGSLTFAPF